MIKESILFVAATGVLIYFVTPSDEAPDADGISEDTQKPVILTTQTSDNGWDYDDKEEEDEASFVFGEPLTNLDSDDDNDSSEDEEEEDRSDRREQTDSRETATKPATRSRQKYSANSPMPSEPGGIDNPIVFATKTPSNPVDD